MRLGLLACFFGGAAGIVGGLSAGCLTCNDSVCSSALWIYAREPGRGALQDGEYVVDLVVDGEADSATCIVSDAGHSVSCDGLEFTIHTPLFGSADNPHTVLHLFFEDAPPEHVELRITHDESVVLDEVFEPGYALAEPKRCDDDCVHATHDFTLMR